MGIAALTLAIAADLFLPVAGNVRSATGREFRTTVWMTNLAQERADVQVTFLERHPAPAPSTVTISLAPAETRELDDLPAQLHRTGSVGALRFTSAQPIAVNSRIYGDDATGEGLAAVGADEALRRGEDGVISGVQFDASGTFRETTYLVETSGRPAGVYVAVRDASGHTVGHETFLLEAYEHRALTIGEVMRGAFVNSGSIAVRVTGGGGRVYAIGFQIPVRSGDGYFIEMVVPRRVKTGASPFEIAMYSLTAIAVIAAVGLDLYRRKRARARLLS